MSREGSRLKSFHCVFKFNNDQVESPEFWPENVSFLRFYLNQKARERLASSKIRNLIKANDLNLITLTETWIKDNANDEFYLQQC